MTTTKKLIPRKINWKYETRRIIALLKDSGALIAYIDLFCGAGGTSTGVEQATYFDEGIEKKLCKVIIGINHDKLAIASHKANHPDTLHMVEDVRHVKLKNISRLIEAIREELPYIKIYLWGSMDCVHHSRAKGGDSRDADSRSLAEELYRYEKALRPDIIQIENVTEIRSWGPLMHKKGIAKGMKLSTWKYKDKVGNTMVYSKNNLTWMDAKGFMYKKQKKKGIAPWMIPLPEKKEEYFIKWKEHLKSLGYGYDDRDLNSANFGALRIKLINYGTDSISIKKEEKDKLKEYAKRYNDKLKAIKQ